MRQLAGQGKSFCIAALTAFAALAASELAAAADTKVPKGDEIKKKLADLYNGSLTDENSTARAAVIVEVGKILDKDKGNVALKNPDFWTDAIQEGRFLDNPKKKLGPTNKVIGEEIEVVLKDGKSVKTKMYFRAGAMVKGSKPAPLVVSVLDKDTDPQKYVAEAWGDAKSSEYGKDWVLVAIAEGDTFPCAKEPKVLGYAFRQIGEHFNIDSNRWFLEGVGSATEAVQIAATHDFSHRLAGLILRDPSKAIINEVTTLYPTIVVRSQTNEPGKAVFEAYKKVDEKNNAEVVVADLPSVKLANEALSAWITQHPRRVLPTVFPWVTTFTGEEGEPWTGCVAIQAPGKYGEKTKLTVKYVRETNTIDVQCENLGEFYVFMNDNLLDLDKEVTVFVNGEQNQKKRVERIIKDAIDNADLWYEYGRIYTASIRCVVPQPKAPAPAAPDPNAKPGDAPADKPGDQPPSNPPPK